MFCSQCGKELPNDSLYCSECGSKIEINSKQENTEKDSRTLEKEISPKSRLIATLLAFFLGTIGVQSFYLERKQRGIVQLSVVGSALICFIISCIAANNSRVWTFFDGWHIESAVYSFFMVMYVILLCISSVWAFIDFICCIGGIMKDAKGRIVKSWDENNKAFIKTEVGNKD